MREYHRAIIFTKVPLTWNFRYRDMFQIFPAVLINMPYSSLQRRHPNILEYWTTPEEEISIPSEFENLKILFSTAATTITKQDKILSLLSTFSNNLFFRYSDLSGFWGMPILKDDPGDEANLWSSKWCWTLFHFPELPSQFKIENFTELNLKDVNRVSHKSYYTYDPNLDFDSKREIEFPETMEYILDSYFQLDSERMQTIDAAISYSVAAMELKDSKKTLSLLSSFSSLETMVNLEFRNENVERCDECGQLKYSIARKFRDFLLIYIGDSKANRKKFNAYYSFRSKIVHTGAQLKTEKLFSEVPEEEADSEYLTRLEILQLGKLAIINWLIFNNKL